jgi:hypothetical protein
MCQVLGTALPSSAAVCVAEALCLRLSKSSMLVVHLFQVERLPRKWHKKVASPRGGLVMLVDSPSF